MTKSNTKTYPMLRSSNHRLTGFIRLLLPWIVIAGFVALDMTAMLLFLGHLLPCEVVETENYVSDCSEHFRQNIVAFLMIVSFIAAAAILFLNLAWRWKRNRNPRGLTRSKSRAILFVCAAQIVCAAAVVIALPLS